MIFKNFFKRFTKKDKIDELFIENEKMIKEIDESLERINTRMDEIVSSLDPATFILFKFKFDDGSVCECELGSETYEECINRKDARLIFD